jgi:hypothetical protein
VNKRGGNAIISYRQVLDNEGAKSKRIVIRGYGTASSLISRSDDEEFEIHANNGILLQNSHQLKNNVLLSKKQGALKGFHKHYYHD